MSATPRPNTPRGRPASSSQVRAPSSSSRVSARSRSGDRIAFGRKVDTPKRGWDVAHVNNNDSPSPLRRIPSSSQHIITIEEASALDSFTVGGPSGSVRLQHYLPAVGCRTGNHVGKTPIPYALQLPVTVTVQNGLLEVRRASSGQLEQPAATDVVGSAMICGLPLDSIGKVETTSSGISCFGRGGLELQLTIHNQQKQSVLFKLLTAKTKGFIPATSAEAEQVKRERTAHEETPHIAASSSTLLQDATARTRMKVARSPVPATSASTETPQSSAPTPAQPVTLLQDRQSRREVLYAQLREIRQREGGNQSK